MCITPVACMRLPGCWHHQSICTKDEYNCTLFITHSVVPDGCLCWKMVMNSTNLYSIIGVWSITDNPGHKFQWNSKRNSIIVIHKMHLKLSSAKMAAILSRGRWVKLTSRQSSHLLKRLAGRSLQTLCSIIFSILDISAFTPVEALSLLNDVITVKLLNTHIMYLVDKQCFDDLKNG